MLLSILYDYIQWVIPNMSKVVSKTTELNKSNQNVDAATTTTDKYKLYMTKYESYRKSAQYTLYLICLTENKLNIKPGCRKQNIIVDFIKIVYKHVENALKFNFLEKEIEHAYFRLTEASESIMIDICNYHDEKNKVHNSLLLGSLGRYFGFEVIEHFKMREYIALLLLGESDEFNIYSTSDDYATNRNKWLTHCIFTSVNRIKLLTSLDDYKRLMGRLLLLQYATMVEILSDTLDFLQSIKNIST